MIRILFICGCVEKGKDGVGDYTRALVSELRNFGVACHILAINDRFLQQASENGISRLSSHLSDNQRKKNINNIIDDFNPSSISLQFVPYSFDQKGIVARYLPLFKAISTHVPFHIMFHELWIDIDPKPSIKTRLFGYLQRYYIKALVKGTKPFLIHTSNQFYIDQLHNNNIEALDLPLLSNIPLEANISYNLVEPILQCTLKEKENYFVVCFFGSIYGGWDYGRYFENLISKVRVLNKKLMVIAIGKIGKIGIWECLCRDFSDRIIFRASGQQDEKIISILLSLSDIGISTTPAHLIAKSGSSTAMLQHGLRVMLVRKFEAIKYQINNKKIIDTTAFDFNFEFLNYKMEPDENYNKEIISRLMKQWVDGYKRISFR